MSSVFIRTLSPYPRMSSFLETWNKLPTWLKVVLVGGGAAAAHEVFGRLTEKSVEGEVVLITGAGSGIGRLMALKFAKLRARLALWDVNEDGVKATEREILESGGEAKAYKVDVVNREQIAAAAADIRTVFGPVTILINNAGIVSGKKMLENSPEAIQRTFEVNTLSHFWTVKTFLPDMIANNHGHIVTISSASAFIGVPGLADYAASKWAVFGFHESLRLELKKLKKNGVHTTLVCPYYIATGMFEGVESRFGTLFPILKPEYVASSIVTAVKRNKELIVLPWHCILTYLMRVVMNTHAFDWAAQAMGVTAGMDNFKGRANNLALPSSGSGSNNNTTIGSVIVKTPPGTPLISTSTTKDSKK